jgi:diaminopimelate decarboxylase
MHQFRYVKNQLFCEDVSVGDLADKLGTPLYVYSQTTLEDHFRKIDRALSPIDHLVCFAMKANSNLSVMRTFSNLGSGFDIVSAGELQRVIAAGGDPRKCVFAGVAKTEAEIEFALQKGVYSFNCESEPEILRINRVAGRLGKAASIAVRVNPNVEAHTHAKITTGTYENKFGIAFENIAGIYAWASKLKNIRLRGLQMHIGSQITETGPFVEAVRKITPLVKSLSAKYELEFLSIGGGIGIVYKDALASGAESWWRSKAALGILTPESYAKSLLPLLQGLGLKVLVEPGRFLVGNAGILVTRVEYLKDTGHKHFVIVDAAMNDLIRPAFYDSYHEIVPLRKKGGARVTSDVVGGVCESGDYFCKDRPLPRVREGDRLALMSAGAYGCAMGSTYNTRPLAAEVLVKGRKAALVRSRQAVKQIWENERMAGWL